MCMCVCIYIYIYIYIYNTLATEELTHWEKPWCWERLNAGREEDNRGWDGWMASLTQCTWVWASSGTWWWIGKPGVLQSMGSQRVWHNWETELNWIGGKYKCSLKRRPYNLGILRESVSPLILPTVVLPMCVHLQKELHLLKHGSTRNC